MDLTRELPFKVGDEIKNYKEMCKLLGEKERGGNSRKSQLKRWQNYFSWEQVGHRFKIIEVIKSNYPTHDDNYIGFNTKKYSESLQQLILNLLYEKGKSDNSYKTILALKTIAILTTMASSRSFTAKYRKEELESTSKELDVSPEFLTEIINKVHDTAYRDAQTALRQLKRKMLIDYEEVLMSYASNKYDKGISPTQIVKLQQDLGYQIASDMVDFYGLYLPNSESETHHENTYEYDYRETHDFEKGAILKLKHMALEKVKLENIAQVIQAQREREYFFVLKGLYREYLGIEYVYTGYKVFFAQEVLEKQRQKNQDLYKLSESEKETIEKVLQGDFFAGLNQNFIEALQKAQKDHLISFHDETEIDPKASRYAQVILQEPDAHLKALRVFEFAIFNKELKNE